MIAATLLRHYRRHPMQGVFLLAGIVMANVLLVGTQLINAQARASYAQGERVMGAAPRGEIVPRHAGDTFDEGIFVALRRQGFDGVAPLLRGALRTADGRALSLVGVDALSMPSELGPDGRSGEGDHGQGGTQAVAGRTAFGDFAFPPYAILAAPARLAQLGLSSGDQLSLADGRRLPALRAVHGGQLGHRMLIDLGALQELAGQRGKLSALLVFGNTAEQLAALVDALPAELEYRPHDSAPDPAELTRSLHLNLAAMGLLACVVGLFLTYNAIAFSYTDRRELLRKMRLAGVSRRELGTALLVELLAFLVAGGLLGAWLGSLLAARLLPGLGVTLVQLYDVYIAYPDGLLPTAFVLPLATTALTGLVCAAFPLREALYAPMLQRRAAGWSLQAVYRRDRSLFRVGLLLLALAAVLGVFAESLWVALAGMASLLLGAALCLPALLRRVLEGLLTVIPGGAVRWQWLAADSRWLLGPAALALMAMTLALVANSGLNTMIGSFRDATDHWLEQRLAAQLFLRDDDVQKGDTVTRLDRWLRDDWPQTSYTLRHRREIEAAPPGRGGAVLEVGDLSAREPFRSSVVLMRAAPDAQALFYSGRGAYVSERAWRLDRWALGDTLQLCAGQAPLTIVGVYRDYGNPRSQVLVSAERFRACWPLSLPQGIAIHGPPELDWARLRGALIDDLALRDSAVIDQQSLRDVGMAVFDRTFAVTRALNLLTLVVAGIGIFCAVSAIHHHRTAQQGLLASLGMSRRERAALLLCQWGVLALLCAALVWPFGVALAWYLAAVVTPVAFGWSFPLRIDWVPYATLTALATTAVMFAVAVPSLRLLRVSPAAMLREQSL